MDSGRYLSLLAVASSRACFVYLAPSISYAPVTQDTQATHQAEAYLGFHRPQRRLEPLGPVSYTHLTLPTIYSV